MPHAKATSLARAERKYRRKVASPKQWAAIRAEKLDEQPCRLCGEMKPLEAHHLASRGAQLGDDVSANIVGVCKTCHARVTEREPSALADLAVRLSDVEYAFLKQTFGEGIMERLFGVGAPA